MGMYDSFYFETDILPKCPVEVEGHEFQSKCLGCDLDRYEIDAQKNVLLFKFWDKGYESKPSPEERLINDSAYIYTYDTNDKYVEYKIMILNSKLVHIEKVSGE